MSRTPAPSWTYTVASDIELPPPSPAHCPSSLVPVANAAERALFLKRPEPTMAPDMNRALRGGHPMPQPQRQNHPKANTGIPVLRPEERRVGQESGSTWSSRVTPHK